MWKALTRATLTVLLAASASSAWAGTLSGTALYRERIALPPDAVFEAVVQDVSRADAPAQVIGRSTLDPAGQPPFRFEIAYDDQAIKPGHRYAVRATVRHQGRLLFTTDTHIPAFENGTAPLQIRLVSVAGSAGQQAGKISDSPLRNTYWKLVRLHQAPVLTAERQREPHLIFSATELRLSGNGGCNGLMGGFDTQGDRITFKGVASTMMACPEGMAQETQFLRALGTVTRYRIAGNQLDLLDAGNAVVARFEAVALR